MVERQILSPMPMPSDLVEKKGENSRSPTSREMPWPRSATLTATPPASGSTPAAMRSTRRAGSTSRMASMALRVRLSSTCSSITGSASTGGRPGSISVWIVTKCWLACSSASWIAPSTRAARSTLSRLGSRRFTKVCTLRMMWPARWIWALAFSSAFLIGPVSSPPARACASSSMLKAPVV